MKIKKITGQDKKDFPNGFISLKLKSHETILTAEEVIKLISLLKNEIQHNVKTLVCGTCNTELNKMDNGELFCPSCLKQYKQT